MNLPASIRMFAMHPRLRMRMHAAPKSAPCQMDPESRLLALLGPREMSDLSPHSGPKRT